MATKQALERRIATPEEFERILRATRANQYMRDVIRHAIVSFANESQHSERDEHIERNEMTETVP